VINAKIRPYFCHESIAKYGFAAPGRSKKQRTGMKNPPKPSAPGGAAPLFEKLRMGAETGKSENFRLFCPVNQKQVRLDMALPITVPVADKGMVAATIRQRFIFHQGCGYGL
jgi:hypothetical protein